jgi:hypothetical protein
LKPVTNWSDVHKSQRCFFTRKELLLGIKDAEEERKGAGTGAVAAA